MDGRVLMGGVGMMGLWYGGFYFSAVVILYREEVVQCRRWFGRVVVVVVIPGQHKVGL